MAQGRSYAERVADQTGVDIPPEAPEPLPNMEAEDKQPAERPDFLLERFQSVEEQAKGYAEAEREMHRTKQELRSSRDTISALAERLEAVEQQQRQPQQPQQGYNPETDPWLQAEVSAWEEGDYARAIQYRDARQMMIYQAYEQQRQPQQQQVPQETARQDNMAGMLVEMAVSQKVGADWPDLRDEVIELVNQNPHFVSQSDDPQRQVNDIVFIADTVRNRRLAEQNQRQAAQAAQGARNKLLAQTAPGSSGRQPAAVDPADLIVEQWKNLPRSYGSQ